MAGRCPLCKSKSNKGLYKKNGHKVVECTNCSLIFINPFPNQKQLEKFYKNFQYGDGFIHEKEIRKDAKRILRNLKTLGYRNGKMLDIGCGFGFLLDEARKVGWDTLGIEMASNSVKFARENQKLKVVETDIHEFNTKEKFRVIILSQVIEHLPDPYLILEKISSLLEKNGLLCISTPNITSLLSKVLKENFNYMDPPNHLLYFSPKTFKKLMIESKFEVVKTITYAYPEEVGSIYRKLREKHSKLKLKDEKVANPYRNITCGEISIKQPAKIKSIKSFIFENILCKTLTPLLNVGLNGSMIEIYAKKEL